VRGGFDAEAFRYSESVKIVEDRDHRPVLLFRSPWNLDMARQKNADLVLAETGDAPAGPGDEAEDA
jgi:peptide subunit release factor RF-3